MDEKSNWENVNTTFLKQNFLNYRTKNDDSSSKFIEIKDDDKYLQFNENNLSTVGVDSAYQSAYSYLSTTPSFSTLGSSGISTHSSVTQSFDLTKYSSNSQSNNYENKSENINKNECLTLTPVTQNAQRISAFHITTPKNESNLHCFGKRSSNYSLDEIQRTPKKFKSSEYDMYSTPQKHKNKKAIALKRLHSAPDFENSNKEDEIRWVWKTPAQSTPKRNPLHPIQQITHSSTPINSSVNRSKRSLLTTPLSKINENSLNNLLNCSNHDFESILNSNALSSPRKTKFGINKRFDNISHSENDTQLNTCVSDIDKKASCKTFRRFLKFSSHNNPLAILKEESTFENNELQVCTTTQNKRKTYPAIHSVIHDRLKAKKRVNAERLAKLNGKKWEHNLENDVIDFQLVQNDVLNDTVSNHSKINDTISNTNLKHINMDLLQVMGVEDAVEIVTNTEEIINMDITPKCNKSLDISSTNLQYCDMDISPITVNLELEASKKNNDEINHTKLQIIEDVSLDDFIPLTPPSNKSMIDEGSKYLKNIANSEIFNYEKSPPTTPPRKSFRSASTSSQKPSLHCIDKEKFEILYPTIPETPKKKIKSNSPKKSPKRNKKPVIKSQTHSNRIFYNGSTYLNIIARLESYTIVLEKIFHYLSDKDLLNLSMTTKVYRTILHENYKANLRLIKFIRDYKVRKENYCRQSHFDNKKEKSDSINKNNDNCNKVKPFRLHNEKLFKNNFKYSTSEESPPVSPSKSKFHQYQKIIRNLSNDQSMGKCPRCAMASRIINQPPLESFSELELSLSDNNSKEDTSKDKNEDSTDVNFNNNINTNRILFSKLQPQQSCLVKNEQYQQSITDLRRSSLKIQSTQHSTNGKNKLTKAFSVDSWQGQLRKCRLLQEISKFQPYGECTSIKCKFKYCLECFCDYHPKQKCKLTESISPSKEDIQNGILQIIKSPKRNNSGVSSKSNGKASRNLNMKRKSLKRLCFN